MSIIATGSKVSRQNAWIIFIMCAAFGLYFAYDGHISQDWQRRNVTWEIESNDFTNPIEFASRLQLGASPAGANTVAGYLFGKFSASGQAVIRGVNSATAAESAEIAQQLANELNATMNHTELINSFRSNKFFMFKFIKF